MRIFVTRTAYSGAFGGPDGGDALCATAAESVNKGGTWKAWLSSTSENAIDRQADVGPWYQQLSDGGLVLTFNNKSNLATTPVVPLGIDEAGRSISAFYWTGSSVGGVYSSASCAGWLNPGGLGTYGTTGATTTAWTDDSSRSCTTPGALLCLEQSHEPLADPAPATGRRLFITSVPYTGSMGGLSGADGHCATAAAAANKGGTWRAWLSTSTVSALDRQVGPGPWYQELADGGLLLTFNNRANLKTSPIIPLQVDELGRSFSAKYWTGTTPGGRPSTSTCLNWTSLGNLDGGTVGTTGTIDGDWTADSTYACSKVASLLCVEQE
jgi:hypothetical protein